MGGKRIERTVALECGDECCRLSIKPVAVPQKGQTVLITYNGQEYLGWDDFAHCRGMTTNTLQTRLRRLKCMARPKKPGNFGPANAPAPLSQVSDLLRGWR